MKIFFLLLSFLALNSLLNSQDLLEKKEIELNEKLLQLRSAKTDEEIERLNLLFKRSYFAYL
jgi:Xaa-Pro aminopeptidase